MEDLEKQLIEWLDTKASCYFTKNDNCYIYEYSKCGYEDKLSPVDVQKILAETTIDKRIECFENLLYDYEFYDYENEVINQITDNFCLETEYEQHDTEVQDILVNLISFDYSTYLNDEYNINILIDFNQQDSNYDLSSSSNLDYCKHNNLYTLLRKQGYTKKAYLINLKNNENEFLNSVEKEIINNYYDCITTLVVLKRMSLKDLIYSEEIQVNTNNEIGLFNYWYGSGSLLEIKLEKPFILNRNKDIHFIQVEGAGKSCSWTVNDVYGLVGSCWKY